MQEKTASLLRAGTFLMVVGVLAALSACGSKPAAAPSSPAEVTVVTLKSQALPLTTELPGRTTAYRVAEVRPQVGGVILRRLFTEGGEVRKGEALYQIDPAPFQAQYDSAAAALARAQASATSAAALAERYQGLIEAKAISKQDYDNAVSAKLGAQADVAAAKAQLDSARINLVYTKVLAPIDGRIGRSAVTEGALVTAQQATALAMIQQLDPIYVDMTQPATTLLRLQRAFASGRLQRSDAQHARVQLSLEDGQDYTPDGSLQFSEVTVDPGSGAVTLRAVFPNPQQQLLPGLFVHARIQEGVDAEALLVPQQGVSHNPAGEATVLLAGADDHVELRSIKVDRTVGDQWLVLAGLKPGERVIVEGLQKIKPGDVVHASERATAAVATAAPAEAPPAGAR